MKSSLAIAAAVVAAVGVAVLSGSHAQRPGGANLVQGVKPGKARYPLGACVQFTYAIRNAGSQPITYNFTSSKLFDLWVQWGEVEVYRYSRGKAYATVMTSLTLQPGESRSFEVTWDQCGPDCKQVGPGAYNVYAQLASTGERPPAAKGKVCIGDAEAAIIAVSVAEAVANFDKLQKRTVQIAATYRGWQPNADDPNVKNGPPVTRSDWAICDRSGCMYVTGRIDLSPTRDIGRKITVTGKLRKTAKGQVYLFLENAKIEKS